MAHVTTSHLRFSMRLCAVLFLSVWFAGSGQAAVISQDPPADTVQMDDPEVMPLFAGQDIMGFRNWVASHLVYPAEAMENGIQGRVVVLFIVERDGQVSAVEELRSPSPLLTEEVRRVILSAPRWTPGMQDGSPVRVKFTLPIDFRFP